MSLLCGLLGCEVTCEQACQKLVNECDTVETPLASELDCTESCIEQESLYVEWNDGQKTDAFVDYKNCVGERTCQQIADGECYDPLLYLY
ncbi:MAG: hypothetical protein AAFV53_24035 [Myxococcota bacterium]